MTATTPTTIQAAIQAPLFIDERGCTLNLCDLDLQARLEYLVGHVGAGGPFLAADAHAAAVFIDALHDDGVRSDERRGSGADRVWHSQGAAPPIGAAPGWMRSCSSTAEKIDACGFVLPCALEPIAASTSSL